MGLFNYRRVEHKKFKQHNMDESIAVLLPFKVKGSIHTCTKFQTRYIPEFITIFVGKVEEGSTQNNQTQWQRGGKGLKRKGIQNIPSKESTMKQNSGI